MVSDSSHYSDSFFFDERGFHVPEFWNTQNIRSGGLGKKWEIR